VSLYSLAASGQAVTGLEQLVDDRLGALAEEDAGDGAGARGVAAQGSVATTVVVGGGPRVLAELKEDPGQPGLETLLREVGKLSSNAPGTRLLPAPLSGGGTARSGSAHSAWSDIRAPASAGAPGSDGQPSSPPRPSRSRHAIGGESRSRRRGAARTCNAIGPSGAEPLTAASGGQATMFLTTVAVRLVRIERCRTAAIQILPHDPHIPMAVTPALSRSRGIPL
jgi:hypothetical protein